MGKKGEKKLGPGKGNRTKGPRHGRPSLFSKQLGQDICLRISSGESLRSICRDLEKRTPKGPDICTVLSWLYREEEEYKEFRRNFDQAREMQAEVIFEEAMEIADDATKDSAQIQYKNKRGQMKTMLQPNRVAVDRARLRVDTRKWFLARMAPKKFGEKIDVTTGGKEIKQPRPAVINYLVPSKPKTA